MKGTMGKNLFRRYMLSAGILAAGVGILWLYGASTFEEKEKEEYQDHFNQKYQIFALNLPEEAVFADEPVPLHLTDIQERFDRELHVNTYWQSNTLLLIKKAHRWFPVIGPILKENGVPEDFKYLALIESGLANVVSPAGATGFWQLMEGAAKDNGLEVDEDVDERYHVEKSTQAACDYLKQAKERFGSWTLAAASYNMGMHGLKTQMENQKASNYYNLLLNEETGRYVFRILAAKEILNNPKKYGFHYRPQDLYQNHEYSEVSVDTSVGNFADFAFAHGINYKVLKIFNPWLRQPYLENKNGKRYAIKIPVASVAQKMMVVLPADSNATGDQD